MFRSLSLISLITLLGAMFPFLLLPIITRFVDIQSYGELVVLETFIAIMTPLVQFPLTGIVVEYFKLSNEKFKIYVTNSLLLSIPVFLFAELIVVVFGSLISKTFSVEHIWLYFLPLMVFLNTATQALISIYLCQKNYRGYSWLLLGPNLFNFVLTVIFLILDFGWESKLYGIIISIIIFATYSFITLYKNSYISNNIQTYFVNLNLKFTLHLIPHTLAASLYFVADRLFISVSLGNSQVALYAAGMQLALIMSVIQNSISKAWNPFVLEFLKKSVEDSTHLKKAYFKLYGYMFYACIGVTIIALVIALIINFAVIYFLPASYEESRYLGMILVGAFCILGYYKVVSPILWFHKRSLALSKITVVVFFINLLLNYLLIPVYGIYGASYATAISICFQFVLTLLLVRRIAIGHILENNKNEKRT